jgi:intracellular septation protein
MKVFFDLFPIILFFIAFKIKGIYFATGVAIAAGLLQGAYTYYREKKIDTLLCISLSILVVFGSLTLVFKNPIFIKWKPTVIYWVFSSIIFFSRYVLKKNAMREVFKKQMELPDAAWAKVDFSWGTFFALLGLLNLIVAYTFSTEIWVNFKMFGIIGIMLVFVIVQSIFLSKYVQTDKADPASKPVA